MSFIPTISVTGLGIIGLTIAHAFSKRFPVIGYDIDETRIRELKHGHDRNKLFSEAELKRSSITYTADISQISNANFHIVIVRTGISSMKAPDMSCLIEAS